MQLFIVDNDPFRAAHALADCHIRKQILETAQILTAYWVNSGYERLDWMPKPQNYNHPVAKNVNSENIGWVIKHLQGLLNEFFWRFNHYHSYEYLKFSWNDSRILKKLNIFNYESENVNGFYRMFSGFKPEPSDIVSEYREYYRWKSKKIKNFKYTEVKPPEWLVDEK